MRRIEPIKHGRAVLDDMAGICDLREVLGMGDRRADEVRKSVDCVDLDRRPYAVSLAIADTDGSPPIPAREHRNQEKRLDGAGTGGDSGPGSSASFVLMNCTFPCAR